MQLVAALNHYPQSAVVLQFSIEQDLEYGWGFSHLVASKANTVFSIRHTSIEIPGRRGRLALGQQSQRQHQMRRIFRALLLFGPWSLCQPVPGSDLLHDVMTYTLLQREYVEAELN